MVSLFFCGDIMPGGILPYQEDYISQELLAFMRGFDFRIGTLEAAIGTNLPFDPVKMAGRQNIVYARNEDFYRVKEMGFDVVSLANNHVWDLGEEGLRNTIRLLRESGIMFCGAGMDIEEASRPAVFEKNGLKTAIFAYCMYGSKYLGYVELAGKDKAGVNPLNMDRVVSDIKRGKEEYDKVIIMPHWGREYSYDPLPECVVMAKQMIEAGADAVLGSHTHQMQPLIMYRNKPVCFSMGNFLFPDFYMYPPRPIWYPDPIEKLTQIKHVVGYPFPIEEPILQVWNPVSRYGSVVTLLLEDEKMGVHVRYVHSSNDNVESFSDPDPRIMRRLNKASLYLSNGLYRTIIGVERKTIRFFKSLSKRIHS